MKMGWYAYMVECDDLSLYSGVTNDLRARVRAHNSGKGAKYTRSRRPVHLVWSMAARSKSEALRVEAHLKGLRRSGKEDLLTWGPRGPDNLLLKLFLSEFPPAPRGLSPMEAYLFSMEGMDARKLACLDSLAREFAWAVPTERALEAVADLGDIVEAGAGLGYWASLLRARGCSIAAFDERPAPDPLNMWVRGEPYFPVLQGGPEALRDYRDRALLVCWPPRDSPMASECFAAWGGEKAALVGPPELTADPAFHSWIRSEFVQTGEVPIPGRPGIGDTVTTWRRR